MEIDGEVARGYGESSFVSWRNFVGAPDQSGKPFLLHDVTLRDGEQQAGVAFTSGDKIEIAEGLAAAGVDRIEGGMVAVSAEDRETLKRLVTLDLGPEIWGVIRSLPEDIEQAIDIGVSGVGIIILANDQYCKVFGWTAEMALEKALRTADRARAGGLKTTLLIADSSRMAAERLAFIVRGASESGVYDALALMDTFGALNPRGTEHLVRAVREMTRLEIEFHAHNDFGLGTANALASIEAGADVVHTSVLGLGERVGNAPLEEVVTAARLMGSRPCRANLKKLRSLAETVERCSKVSIAANKAVVGPSYAQIESGTVAREYMRLAEEGEDIQWLFPFDPALVGGGPVELVLGKGSGAANIQAALQAIGIHARSEDQRMLLEAVKSAGLARRGLISTTEFKSLAREAGLVPEAVAESADAS